MCGLRLEATKKKQEPEYRWQKVAIVIADKTQHWESKLSLQAAVTKGNIAITEQLMHRCEVNTWPAANRW